jgi:hypothetical protein
MTHESTSLRPFPAPSVSLLASFLLSVVEEKAPDGDVAYEGDFESSSPQFHVDSVLEGEAAIG